MQNLILLLALAALLITEILIISYFANDNKPGKPFLDMQGDPYFKQFMELSNRIEFVSSQQDIGRLLFDIKQFSLRHESNINHSSFEVTVDTDKLLNRLEVKQIMLEQQGIYLQLQF